MRIGNGEYQLRTMFLDDLNLQMIMDHARNDPRFLGQLISQLQERGENRSSDEDALLEWTCSASRTQSAQK